MVGMQASPVSAGRDALREGLHIPYAAEGKSAPNVVLLPPDLRILAVGEGDFAFSSSLAARHTFGVGALCATALDTEEEVVAKYVDGEARLRRMRELGAVVHCGVDARHLDRGVLAQAKPFDRIVFNFPLLPNYANEDHKAGPDMLVANRLMLTEFLRSAASLLAPGGLVIIASKDCYPYSWWRIKDLPDWSGGRLGFVGELPWLETEYPLLYDGPCNVNRDASVKPTDAVIYIFAHCINDKLHMPAQLEQVFEHRCPEVKGSQRWTCKICGLNRLSSASELASHEAGKIHRKRVDLERRWALALAAAARHADEGGRELQADRGCAAGLRWCARICRPA